MANKMTLQEMMKGDNLGGLSTLEIAEYLNERIACELAEASRSKNIAGEFTKEDLAADCLKVASESILSVCKNVHNADALLQADAEEPETFWQYVARALGFEKKPKKYRHVGYVIDGNAKVNNKETALERV